MIIGMLSKFNIAERLSHDIAGLVQIFLVGRIRAFSLLS